MTVVLAIDQGTSGTKAIVIDDEDRVLGVAERPVSPHYLPGGGVEQDPAELLQSVLDAGRAAIDEAGRHPDIVTLANQGETVLAWDRDTGAPLSNLVVWQDRRADEVCRELQAEAPRFAQRTGLVLDPYFSAPKQAWLRRHVTRDGVVTTSDTWLLHRLTGEFVTDISTAGRSLVTDLDTGEWDGELLDLFGLAGEQLPTILDSDAIAGSTSAFGRPAAVGGLVVDQQAALLAESCLAPGEAKCTFGTGAFLLANIGERPLRSSAGLASSVAWRIDGTTTYCFDGQVYTAASAVRWLQQLGFVREPADLDRVAGEDSGGVVSVPALAGLAAPWWRPNATASLSGMTLSTGPEHIVLAVLQGIVAQVGELVRLIAGDLGAPLTRLRVDGGLTRSRRLLQAAADQLQLEIDVYPSQHATPLGAAALARYAFGGVKSLGDAVVPWTPSEVFTPRWTPGRAEEFRQTWLAAVPEV
jgi:glycerol kinase